MGDEEQPDPTLLEAFPEFEWLGVPLIAIGRHPDFEVVVERNSPQRFRACMNPTPHNPYSGYTFYGDTPVKAVAGVFQKLEYQVQIFLALQERAGDFKDRGTPP